MQFLHQIHTLSSTQSKTALRFLPEVRTKMTVSTLLYLYYDTIKKKKSISEFSNLLKNRSYIYNQYVLNSVLYYAIMFVQICADEHLF